MGIYSTKDVAEVGRVSATICRSGYVLSSPYAERFLGRLSRSREKGDTRGRRIAGPALVPLFPSLGAGRADSGWAITSLVRIGDCVRTQRGPIYRRLDW